MHRPFERAIYFFSTISIYVREILKYFYRERPILNPFFLFSPGSLPSKIQVFQTTRITVELLGFLGSYTRNPFIYIFNIDMFLNCIIYYLGDYIIYIDPELYLGGIHSEGIQRVLKINLKIQILIPCH